MHDIHDAGWELKLIQHHMIMDLLPRSKWSDLHKVRILGGRISAHFRPSFCHSGSWLASAPYPSKFPMWQP